MNDFFPTDLCLSFNESKMEQTITKINKENKHISLSSSCSHCSSMILMNEKEKYKATPICNSCKGMLCQCCLETIAKIRGDWVFYGEFTGIKNRINIHTLFLKQILINENPKKKDMFFSKLRELEENYESCQKLPHFFVHIYNSLVFFVKDIFGTWKKWKHDVDIETDMLLIFQLIRLKHLVNQVFLHCPFGNFTDGNFLTFHFEFLVRIEF